MRVAALVLVLLGAVAAVLLIDSDVPPVPEPAASPAPTREAAVRGVPPRAPVARCRDSITAAGPHDPVVADDTTDRVVGPVRFSGLRLYEVDWEALVADDQWIKTIAVIDAGIRVTLEVPRDQRRWMRVDYGGRGGRAVMLQACRRQPTLYAGGFTIDYAEAPQQGRCAELIVWGDQARRVRLFGVCA
jgi:hypothetical protein